MGEYLNWRKQFIEDNPQEFIALQNKEGTPVAIAEQVATGKAPWQQPEEIMSYPALGESKPLIPQTETTVLQESTPEQKQTKETIEEIVKTPIKPTLNLIDLIKETDWFAKAPAESQKLMEKSLPERIALLPASVIGRLVRGMASFLDVKEYDKIANAYAELKGAEELGGEGQAWDKIRPESREALKQIPLLAAGITVAPGMAGGIPAEVTMGAKRPKGKIPAKAVPGGELPKIPKELESLVKYKNTSELLTSKDNSLKASYIKSYYEANGLKIDKIVRAKLNDGFYVYHQYGSEWKAYKPAKIIEETATKKVTQTQPYKIKSDFIADDSVDQLQFIVIEARNRKGLGKGGFIKSDDFYAQTTGKSNLLSTTPVGAKLTPTEKLPITEPVVKTPEEIIPKKENIASIEKDNEMLLQAIKQPETKGQKIQRKALSKIEAEQDINTSIKWYDKEIRTARQGKDFVKTRKLQIDKANLLKTAGGEGGKKPPLIEYGGGEVPPESFEAVDKLKQWLKEAGTLRKTVSAEQTVARTKQASRLNSLFDEFNQGKITQDELGEQIYKSLSGELIPKEAYSSEGITIKLTEEDIHNLGRMITTHPDLRAFEKLNALEGLKETLSGKLPIPSKIVLLEKTFGKEIAIQMLQNRSFYAKAMDLAVGLTNLPRTLMASLDWSAILRQNIIYSLSHPIKTGKAIIKTFPEIFSPKLALKNYETMTQSPRWFVAEETGLAIFSPTAGKYGNILAQEEKFLGNMRGKLGIPFEASQRAHTGVLNKVRWDMFNMYSDYIESMGYAYHKNPEMWQAISKMVNTFTGRGGYMGADSAAKVFSTIFWSPQLQTARINTLNPIWYARLPHPIRMIALTDLAKTISVGISTLALMQLSGLASVEVDPRSADFGKIKVGNTRFDIWGGLQQWAVFLSREIFGEIKSTKTAEIYPISKEKFPFQGRSDLAINYIKGKLQPAFGLLIELADNQRRFGGEEFYSWDTLTDNILPMYITDMKDALNDADWLRMMEVGGTSFWGIGSQTYGEPWEKPMLEITPSGEGAYMKWRREQGIK